MTDLKAPRFILTTQCPDTTGVVAAVSSFLAAQNGLITEAQHYDDPYSDTSFMRVVFHDNGRGLAALKELEACFAAEVGGKFAMQFQFHEATRKCRVVVAVSKHGHCLNSFLHRWSTATLPVDILAVVSNHEDLRRQAEWHGVPFYYFPMTTDGKAEQEQRIIELFDRVDAELLVLARYMQILSDTACNYFAGRAINIHHSFLPGFKGARPYHQAFERGVKLIGATAHYVTVDLDEGPIIDQEAERVDHTFSPEDLADLGRDLESMTLNRAVKWHAERRVFQNGKKTVVLR
ncbi:MAG TPA: formyltetrahydrofolate deformylase [Steroidobacteraceae bacterium]|nr:formyltetrahydrofolate deformylase [Steroidobacteraceae bacterium]